MILNKGPEHNYKHVELNEKHYKYTTIKRLDHKRKDIEDVNFPSNKDRDDPIKCLKIHITLLG